MVNSSFVTPNSNNAETSDSPLVVCSPCEMYATKGTESRLRRFFGYLMRLGVAYLAVLSLVMMLCDAFFSGIAFSDVALITAGSCAVFGTMCVGALPRRILEGVIAGLVTVYIIFSHDLYTIVYAFCRLWNMAMERIEENGFRVFFTFYYESGFSDDSLSLIGIGAIALLLSLIFCVCLCRKTRLIPMLAAGITVSAAVFTYNISENNWYFAITLASLGGILVLKLYDRLYLTSARNDKAEKKASSSLGGYAGMGALLLTLAVLAIPAATVSERWETIDFIDYRLEYMRAVTSSLIVGEAPNQGDLGYFGNLDTLNSRETEAEERVFTGKTILEVQTSYPYPVYLRSWAGMYYSGDKWYSATTEDVTYYKNTFGESFMPEDITFNFYDVVDPSLTALDKLSSYKSKIDEGLINFTVDVKNIASSGNLLFLPTFTNPDVGLLAYGAEDAGIPYSSDYKNYHDGIITTSWLNFNKQYRTLASVPTYRGESYGDVINAYRAYYSMIMYVLRMCDAGYYGGMTDEEILSEADAMLQKYEDAYGLTRQTTVESFLAMTDEQRANFLYENFTVPQLYKEYVYKYYTGSSGSEAVKETAVTLLSSLKEEYFGDVQDTGTDYAAMLREQLPYVTVMSVIDWLGENCTYTLTPASVASQSPVDAFLTSTHEGYCVQFATSAALILRELGFPARYVEGYLASDFTRNTDPERVNRYVTEVKDYDAHAWIEVYFDGVGWMQFETTPAYYDDMYETYEPSEYTPAVTHDYDSERDESVFEESEAENADAQQDYGSLTVMLVVVAGIAAAVIVPVTLLRRFVSAYREADEKRFDVISEAKKEELDEFDVRRLGKKVGRYIMETFECLGLTPQTGELPSEFAIRAQTELKRLKTASKDRLPLDKRLNEDENETDNFPRVMQCLEAETYGAAMTSAELNECAGYLEKLRADVFGLLSPLQRYIFSRFKRKI